MREQRWNLAAAVDAPLRSRIPTTYHVAYATKHVDDPAILIFAVAHMTRRHRYVIHVTHSGDAHALRSWLAALTLELGDGAAHYATGIAYVRLRMNGSTPTARKILAIQKAPWPPSNITITTDPIPA